MSDASAGAILLPITIDDRLDLHRIEVAIRPENTASLRVVEKLGFTEVGYARGYLHIDGDWRDHRLFALTREECAGGVLRRYRQGGTAAENL